MSPISSRSDTRRTSSRSQRRMPKAAARGLQRQHLLQRQLCSYPRLWPLLGLLALSGLPRRYRRWRHRLDQALVAALELQSSIRATGRRKRQNRQMSTGVKATGNSNSSSSSSSSSSSRKSSSRKSRRQLRCRQQNALALTAVVTQRAVGLIGGTGRTPKPPNRSRRSHRMSIPRVRPS